ncbi:MAG: hypothetical protein NC390_01795 [Fusobacterium sp.]|nr:hypothetical protein [Fusobacterium sp.]
MRISSINTFNPYSNTNKNPKTIRQHQMTPQTIGRYDNIALNNAALFINFDGGASLSLKSTIQNLEFLGQAAGRTMFPPRVQEKAQSILSVGNPHNKRLVDVHKGIFGQIKECETLSEIKSLFREEKFFDDVISDAETTFAEGSFADLIKKGQSEYFDKDEDLSLQIIKLYWGDGFSLSDLKAYTGGKDINYLLNKLNIPKREKNYGSYLKLSDEEYNTRITREMAQKRLEALDRKAQAQEGEPVYIPRRPLSDLHKQHISEGLIKYYQEHPIACYNISQRQREFYENNPEQKLIFSAVLKRAWGLKSAEGIKKALKKYMSKDFNPELLSNPLSMDQKQSAAMKRFWAENEWARKSHSKNMQYGWKVVKEELENPPLIFNYPFGLIHDVIEFGKQRGVTLKPENFASTYNTITHKHMYNQQFFDTFTEFINEPTNADMIASLYQYSLVKSIQNMTRNATPQNIKERKKILEFLTQKYQSQIYDLDPKTGKVIRFKELNIDEARTTFINVQLDLRKMNPDLEEEFVAQLSLDYPIVKEEALKNRK